MSLQRFHFSVIIRERRADGELEEYEDIVNTKNACWLSLTTIRFYGLKGLKGPRHFVRF